MACFGTVFYNSRRDLFIWDILLLPFHDVERPLSSVRQKYTVQVKGASISEVKGVVATTPAVRTEHLQWLISDMIKVQSSLPLKFSCGPEQWHSGAGLLRYRKCRLTEPHKEAALGKLRNKTRRLSLSDEFEDMDPHDPDAPLEVEVEGPPGAVPATFVADRLELHGPERAYDQPLHTVEAQPLRGFWAILFGR